jgi:C-terminal processing protease CtpA/Prc
MVTLFAAFTLMFAGKADAAGEKGWFGIGVAVETEGFFLDPTLLAVKIDKVVPSSPAATAGLTAGDSVIEVEGIVVAGARARDVQAAMDKGIGESLHLRVKNINGVARVLTLKAAARPAEL